MCGMQGVGLGMQGVRYRAVVFKTRLLLRRARFFILFYFFKLCGAPEREERERERENKEKERGSVCGYAWGESGGETERGIGRGREGERKRGGGGWTGRERGGGERKWRGGLGSK